jgi:hypothetical protein
MLTNSRLVAHRLRTTALLLVMSTAACARSIRVATTTLDPAPIGAFKTFAVIAPEPPADRVMLAASNDSGGATAVLMDMDPMLATSLVGRAIRVIIVDAFTQRGYRTADGSPDFYVAYYAGVGRAVDTRASLTKYHYNGEKLTTQTIEYPAGTIVVDVVDAKTNSLVWRGTALSEIPEDPNDYARAIRATVQKIVRSFPSTQP